MQTGDHVVAVAERLACYCDADWGGAGGDEPGAGGGMRWEGGVGWMGCGGRGGGRIRGGDGRHCWDGMVDWWDGVEDRRIET